MASDYLARALTGISFLLFTIFAAVVNATLCRHIPGDDEWPSQVEWASLNKSVKGRLIATIPLASICHIAPYYDYNETACKTLADGWSSAQTFEPHPAEMMNAYYQNQSCDPFTLTSQPCQLGNYPVYSINVSSPEDVRAGIEFAQTNNIRLVIKTTGHDYTGKSSGLGTLSLWTWNLKEANVIPQYTSTWYSGPAIKLGSGMIAGDAYAIAHAAGYRIVGGDCGSIGIAAGYSQGGGHSLLNTAYGMAADQVLEWEVVTAAGEHLIATPEDNSDLYWALSGGGGGTFAVVLSMTSRIYPDGPVAGGSLSFNNTNAATYWEAVSLCFQHASAIVGNNNTALFTVLDIGFNMLALTLPDQPSTAVSTLLAPYLAKLDQLNITYDLKETSSNSYYDHFDTYLGPLPYGPEPPSTILMNRLIPQAVVASANATAQLLAAYRQVVAGGDFLVGCSFMNVANHTVNGNKASNSVLPAWRMAIAACNVNAYWNYTAPLSANYAQKRRLVEELQPAIEAATLGSGVYMNEIDPWYRGDWKTNLYGVNYERLLGIKYKWDPEHLFWGNFSVGSDELFLDDGGRLCNA